MVRHYAKRTSAAVGQRCGVSNPAEGGTEQAINTIVLKRVVMVYIYKCVPEFKNVFKGKHTYIP
jgi:hypothetical protein